MRRWLSCLLVALALSPAALVADDVRLISLDSGEPTSLESFHQPGKWLVVMIWASDCPVCNREASHYSDFHMLHSDDDATMVGVSLDGQNGTEAAHAFVDRHMVSFPNVIVEPAEYIPHFESITGARWLGTPTFLLYDPQGELRAQQAGAVPVNLIEEFIAR